MSFWIRSTKLLLLLVLTLGLSGPVVYSQPADQPDTSAVVGTTAIGSATSGSPATAALGPRIVFATPDYDFGRVPEGQLIRYNFTFTNTGDQTLELTYVRPACGCTTAEPWDRKIEPGQTGKIPVQLKTDHYSGTIKKTIQVGTNVPDQKQLTLSIGGTVWQPVEITPGSANLGSFAFSSLEPHSKTIRIVSHLEEPLEIKSVTSDNPLFLAEIKAVTPGQEYELVVSVTAPPDPGGHRAELTLETTNAQKPKIFISANCFVLAPVQVSPAKIILPAGPLGQAFEKTVHVINNLSTALEVLEAKVSSDAVSTQIEEVRPGKQFRVKLGFPAGFLIPEGENIVLRIKTNESSVPVLETVITQYRPGAPAVSGQ